MRAPSKAGANKLDKPTRVKPNQQPGTEPHVWQGNEPCEADGRAVGLTHSRGVGIVMGVESNKAYSKGLAV